MRLTLAFCLIAGGALPVAAQTFTPPEGCSIFMTVQSRACRVSNHFTCTQDAAGDQWRADFDQEGIFFQSKINSEAEWIESFDMPAGIAQRLDPNPEDPASFSELLSSGTDTFAFTLSHDDQPQTKVTGFDRLTGKTWTIDGVTLSETQFEFTETDMAGNILRQSRGREYISPEKRMFFSGPSEWNGGDGQFLPMDGSPLQFIFPGEPGFGSSQPLFDCDAILSSLPRVKEAPSHDNL